MISESTLELGMFRRQSETGCSVSYDVDIDVLQAKHLIMDPLQFCVTQFAGDWLK